MSMTVEQFLSFSESEQLQTVKELNDTGNVKTIIDVLTSRHRKLIYISVR